MPYLTSLLRVGEDALRQMARLADFAGATDLPPAPDDSPEGAEVATAVIFADIEGFSQLVADEGDDVATVILDHLDLIVADAIERHPTARVIKKLGDGVMLAVDDPVQALCLTAELPAAFATAMEGTRRPLRLRAGGHHGSARRRGEDLIGYHVNVAARVASTATGGQALVTRALLTAAAEAVADPASMGEDESEVGHKLPLASPAGRLDAKGVPEHPPLFLLHLPD